MKDKTYQPNVKEIERSWHLVDAKGQVLGRLATGVAQILIGKHKASYSPQIDAGDYVVVVNAEKVKLTGKKAQKKVYRRHTGYPGGFKEVSFSQMSREHPTRVIELAVSGMLPDNRLKKNRLARLKVVVGEENPYKEEFKNA